MKRLGMSFTVKGPGNSMSQVVGLPSNSYKPITNTAWVRAPFCKLQKGCTRLAAASDKVYQLLAHGRWFSPGISASSTTKTGCHDIAEILLKVALKHQKLKQIKSFTVMPQMPFSLRSYGSQFFAVIRQTSFLELPFVSN